MRIATASASSRVMATGCSASLLTISRLVSSSMRRATLSGVSLMPFMCSSLAETLLFLLNVTLPVRFRENVPIPSILTLCPLHRQSSISMLNALSTALALLRLTPWLVLTRLANSSVVNVT